MPAGGSVVRALVLFAAFQSPQTLPSAATGLILGRVVDAGNGQPISGAIVSLQGPPATGAPRALTNARGQFVFRNLPKGGFSMNVTRPGYLDGAYGRHRPGGTTATLQLDEGGRVGDVVLQMWRGAVISGTVVDEAGEPLVGAGMRAFRRTFIAGRRRYMPAGVAMTDDRGMYRFSSLTPGDYVVAFLSREVTVPASFDDVRNAAANPNDKTSQAVMQSQLAIGAFSLSPSSGDGLRIGDTARQIPSLGPVPPMSSDVNAATYTYPTLYFPNAPTPARASVITLASGQQRESVDLALHPLRAFRVSGTIVGPEGPASRVPMRLVPAGDDSGLDIEVAATVADVDGSFTFFGAIPGQYVIKAANIARPPQQPIDNAAVTRVQVGSSMSMSTNFTPPAGPPPVPDDPSTYGTADVGVGNMDVKGVIVPLQRGGRLTGRLEFDGTLDRPDADAMSRTIVVIDRADAPGLFGSTFGGTPPIPPAGRADETGAFKTYGQAPGKYLVRVGAPTGWTLKSVTVEGRDISEAPFDIGTGDINNVIITFTDRPTKITGTVQTKDGNADPDALVVAFPVDPAAWSESGANPRRARSTRVAKTGTFTITGLPPGEYYVAAIVDQDWQDPQALAEIARNATTVRLSDGDTRAQNLVRAGSDR